MYSTSGQPLSVTPNTAVANATIVAKMNPLRYRGYYYDTDTGFYYLQSRYYDPNLGRFINADSYSSTGQGILGNNMYAYCNNNAVNLVDTTGTLPFGIGPMTVAINDGGGGISIELSIDVFIRQRRKSKAEEKDSSGNYTLNAKIIQTTQAFERNFVILMSVGLGLYGGVIATEYASLIFIKG